MANLASLEYKDRVGYFPYSNAKEKQENRQFKLDCMKKLIPNAESILTLAAESFTFEQMIAQSFEKINLIESYERNSDVFKLGLKKFRKLKKEHSIIHYKNDDIFNAKFSKHDVIDLDLCGTFTIETVLNIVSMAQQFEQGLFIVTLTKSVRRSSLIDNIKDFGSDSLDEFRTSGFAKYLKKVCNLDEYCKPYEYANKSVNPYAKPMITYVFTKNLVWGEAAPNKEKLILKKKRE